MELWEAVRFLHVLKGLHIVSPKSRVVALSLVCSSVLVVWFGVVLTH